MPAPKKPTAKPKTKSKAAKQQSSARSAGGRPSKFKPEYVEQAQKLGRLGAIDAEIADFFSVSESTLNKWKKDFPEFSESLKGGKLLADAEVADSLYQRAKGYSHPDVHISNYQGEVTITKITKHYPPDATSMIFWLKNRRPDLWRDKPAEGDDGALEGILAQLIEKLPG